MSRFLYLYPNFDHCDTSKSRSRHAVSWYRFMVCTVSSQRTVLSCRVFRTVSLNRYFVPFHRTVSSNRFIGPVRRAVSTCHSCLAFPAVASLQARHCSLRVGQGGACDGAASLTGARARPTVAMGLRNATKKAWRRVRGDKRGAERRCDCRRPISEHSAARVFLVGDRCTGGLEASFDLDAVYYNQDNKKIR